MLLTSAHVEFDSPCGLNSDNREEISVSNKPCEQVLLKTILLVISLFLCNNVFYIF